MSDRDLTDICCRMIQICADENLTAEEGVAVLLAAACASGGRVNMPLEELQASLAMAFEHYACAAEEVAE